MDTTSNLRDGDLRAWALSLPADQLTEYDTNDDGEEWPSAVHVLVGVTDVLVRPIGRDEDGTIGYDLSSHTHPDLDTARACYRRNRDSIRRRLAEAAIDMERAAQRTMLERRGMPLEVIDRMLPLVDPQSDKFASGLQTMLSDGPPANAPVSGPPARGWTGDEPGFYL